MLLDYIKNRIQRTAIRIGTACIRNKYKRGALRSKLLYKHSPVSFTIYNKFFPVYPPHYSPDNLPYGDEPKIYNKDGERMRMFFFRDYISALFPAAPSKYFLCDRYNFGLDTHFYGNWSMLEPMGKPTRRYGYTEVN